MSELAATHYIEMAERFKIPTGAMPEVLNGITIPLSVPGVQLPMRGESSPVSVKVAENYERIVRGLSGFVLACATDEMQEVEQHLESRARTLTRGHMETMYAKLLKPVYLSTGNMSDAQIQTVTPGELPKGFLGSALHLPKGEQAEFEARLSRTVLLVTSALISGHTPSEGYTAFVTLLRPQNGPSISCTGRQFTRGQLKSQKNQWRPVPLS